MVHRMKIKKNNSALFCAVCALILSNPSAYANDRLDNEFYFAQQNTMLEIQSLAQNCSSVTAIGIESTDSTLNILDGLSESTFSPRYYLGIDQKIPQEDALDKESPTIAVCYWGLTRSTKKVYKTHNEHLFQQLEKHNIHYDVYMHTWRIQGKQFINNHTTEIPVDYNEYKLLNPTFYRIDNQEDFTSAMDFSLYFYQHVWDEQGHCMHGEWPPQLILNHLCALESQKRVTEMVLENGQMYDFIIYVRPDVCINTPLDIQSVLDLKEGEIIIPNFAHYEGYNDRFAIVALQTAPIYGKRIDSIAEFRATQGRIVSEKYVKYICDKNNLKVKFIDFHFDIVRP